MRRPMQRALLSTVSLLVLVAATGAARAGCTPASTAGNDTIVCDAATAPDPTAAPINLLTGVDQLTINSGTYSGGITGAAGTKTIILNGGAIASYSNTLAISNILLAAGGSAAITGGITTGAFNDRLEINSGTVGGLINQGDGIDTFVMTGGQIQTIDQGGDLDQFIISGGRVVGGFLNGDFLTMTGGRIGFVALNQANNVMTMSGGIVDGDVTAEQNNDTLNLSGGTIGGQVDFGSGNNIFNITGGSIGNGIVSTGGVDQLNWNGGGTIAGAINLGGGNDSATLRNLTSAIVAPTTSINGGLGNDTLTFDATEMSGIGRFINWETVNLVNGARLTLDSSLVLGDTGTGTGAMSIGAGSTLLAGNGVNPVIRSFTAGQLAAVTNAGNIDLTNGGATAANSLTIAGNYIGAGGLLNVRSVLAGDGAASDRLVVSGGSATGSTGIGVTNAGGSSASTISDGILVVQAVNGGTTAAGAFGLTGRVAAGAYEYQLFRGGVTAGTADNWYLRSALVPGTAPAAPPVGAPPIGTPALPPVGASAVLLYRPEVALYAAVPQLAQQLGQATLGTFHERQGEQALLQGQAGVPGAWARAFGGHTEQTWSGAVSPQFSGTIAGVQTGLDLWARQSPNGHRDHIGVFFGYAKADGDVRGFALGEQGRSVGTLSLSATSGGAYWTHVGPSGWYLDGVVMGTAYDGSPHAAPGTAASIHGSGFTAAVEGGYPIPLTANVSLEPQAQLIWQRQSFDDFADRFSTIGVDTADALTGRIGARLLASTEAGGTRIQPYLKANLWQDFNGTNQLVFGGADVIPTKRGATALEVGGGLVAQISRPMSVYVTAAYVTDVDGNQRETVTGNLGLRMIW